MTLVISAPLTKRKNIDLNWEISGWIDRPHFSHSCYIDNYPQADVIIKARLVDSASVVLRGKALPSGVVWNERYFGSCPSLSTSQYQWLKEHCLPELVACIDAHRSTIIRDALDSMIRDARTTAEEYTRRIMNETDAYIDKARGECRQ